MAKHDIEMRQTARLVGSVDVIFDVWSDEQKLGQLRLSKGGVDWWPGRSKSYYYRWSWERLADVLKGRVP
jgi:hypothetical protein